MNESDIVAGMTANSEKQGEDSGSSMVSSNPKVTGEDVLTSPVPKRGCLPIYLGPLASFKPNKFGGSLTLQALEDIEKLHQPAVKEQTILMSQCPGEKGLKALFNELYPTKRDHSAANKLRMMARISLVLGPSNVEWERIIAGEDKKFIEAAFRSKYVRTVPRLPTVPSGPQPGQIAKKTVVETAPQTVEKTPVLAPHLDASLTAEQLNKIYLAAKAFPTGETLKTLYQVQGLNTCEKWKKSAFLAVLFRNSESLSAHTEKKAEEKVEKVPSAQEDYDAFFGVENENPPEAELVMKSSTDAAIAHPPHISGSRAPHDLPERIFPKKLLARDNSAKYEERRGRSRSPAYGDSRRGYRRDYDDRDDRHHNERHHRRSPEREYRRSPDRRDRDFRNEYEDFNPRRDLDRSGWKERNSRNWSESQGHSLDEPLRFTGAHLSGSQTSYGRGLNLTRPASPFGGSPQGAKREVGYARSGSHSPDQTSASGDAGLHAIAPSTMPTVGALLTTTAIVHESVTELADTKTDADGTVWRREKPADIVTISCY